MDSDDKTVVLNEVEHLLKKLSALPDDVKQAAFDKIQAQLNPLTVNISVKCEDGTRNIKDKVHIIKHDPEVLKKVDSRGKSEQKSLLGSTQDNRPKELNAVVNTIYPKRDVKLHQNVKNIIIKEPIITRKKSKEYELSIQSMEVRLPEVQIMEVDGEEKSKESDAAEVLLSDGNFEVTNGGVVSNIEKDIETSAKDYEKSSKSAGSADDKENASDEEESPKTIKRRGRPSRKHRINVKRFCKDCDFETTRSSQMEIHKRKHSGFKPYACPECGKAFPHSSGLNVHIKRHKGQRDYPCELCTYRAYTKIDKTRHMTVHTGERNHICEYCGKAFAKDSTLREHVKSIHERKEKYVCEECGFLTYRANNLRVHIRMVHRGEFDNHVCPVCGAQVKQRSAFLEHMRAHTGERPFQCKLCPSSFACPARLTVHVNSVHAPRSFPCNQCSKIFQTKHHLLRHQIIHTNERPFSCPYCSYACNTQGNMSKHVRAVHQMPDFSFRKHKAALQKSNNPIKSVNTVQESKVESDENSIEIDSSGEEWVRKGQRVTEEYLKLLSAKLGREITLEELQAKEEEKKKRMYIEQYNARLRRISRISTPEHSYYSKNNPEKLDDSKKRGKSSKSSSLLEDEDTEMDVPGTNDEEEVSNSGDNQATIIVGTVGSQSMDGSAGSVIQLNTGLSNTIQQVSLSAPAYQTVYLPSGMVMTNGGQLYRIVTSVGEEIQLNSAQEEENSNESEAMGEPPDEESAEPTVVVIINTDENSQS